MDTSRKLGLFLATLTLFQIKRQKTPSMPSIHSLNTVHLPKCACRSNCRMKMINWTDCIDRIRYTFIGYNGLWP